MDLCLCCSNDLSSENFHFKYQITVGAQILTCHGMMLLSSEIDTYCLVAVVGGFDHLSKFLFSPNSCNSFGSFDLISSTSSIEEPDAYSSQSSPLRQINKTLKDGEYF